VLDLSKIEAGKMGLHLETFDVPLMVEEMVTTLQPAISKNANAVRVRLADDVSLMRADATKVRQILFNLMSNACKFTDHGTISLDVSQSAMEGQEWIRFRVNDTGIGISSYPAVSGCAGAAGRLSLTTGASTADTQTCANRWAAARGPGSAR